MDWDLKKFRDLIIAVFEHHERPESYSHAVARNIFYQIQVPIPCCSREELIRFLPSEQHVEKDFGRTLLYLKPVTHGPILVPVLSIKCDFGRSVPEVGLHLGIFLQHNEEIKFFGFRFEAPHGEGSVHHYYHMQMIRSLPFGGFLPNDNHSGFIPDSEPTFPLDVDSPVQLFMSVLISLYGIKDLAAFLGVAGAGNEFNDDLERLKSYRQPPLSWNWTVSIGDPVKTTIGYETPSLPEEAKKKIRAAHPNQKTVIAGMTKGSYDLLPKTKRKVL